MLIQSKAAIISESKSLSRELGSYNIRVNCIAPGLTDTDMMKNNTPEKTIRNVLERIALKELQTQRNCKFNFIFSI